MPSNDQFNYTGIKASHSGGWDALDYHHPKHQHPNKLEETSKKRALKARPKTREPIKPVTKSIDMATGKKTPVDNKLEQANTQDLQSRGLK